MVGGNWLIGAIGQRYNIILPKATKVRKVGATSVALNVGAGGIATLVKCQLSHTAVTDEKYYQAIVGNKHSAEAFSTMEALIEGTLADSSCCSNLIQDNDEASIDSYTLYY